MSSRLLPTLLCVIAAGCASASRRYALPPGNSEGELELAADGSFRLWLRFDAGNAGSDWNAIGKAVDLGTEGDARLVQLEVGGERRDGPNRTEIMVAEVTEDRAVIRFAQIDVVHLLPAITLELRRVR